MIPETIISMSLLSTTVLISKLTFVLINGKYIQYDAIGTWLWYDFRKKAKGTK